MSRRLILSLSAVAAVTALLAATRWPAGALWPPLAGLVVIAATRRALVGLLAGGLAGAVLLAGGDPLAAVVSMFADQLLPSLQSPWKLGAISFTVLLGGFAAVLEAGGGFARLMRRAAGSGTDAPRRLEAAAAGLGLLCFFDGLANGMVVGRVGRDLADRHGVARVKLAYIADSTSSAVACVALVSTWIAFQLGLIAEAFAAAGREVNPYAVFLSSLPYNFYCWFTLVLLFSSIRHRFHPGPMGSFCEHGSAPPAGRTSTADEGPARSALVPLAVLLAAFFALFVLLGGPRPILPLTRGKIVAAFGSDAGPGVLVLAAAIATLAAVALFPRRPAGKLRPALSAFAGGMAAMAGPILILLAAWILGGVVSDLGTAALIARLATGGDALFLVPTLTFVAGAAVSFATGTSWGTMGLLFPLVVPAAAAMGASPQLLTVVVAAVFSGAVFGDHCSPFSDTTIVTSISCGVEPHDHVRTQIPYALITAAVAVLGGFLPAGLGAPAWTLLIAGAGILWWLPALAACKRVS